MEYVQLVCALIGVLALIFLFFWILRKVNKGILSVSGKRSRCLTVPRSAVKNRWLS